MKRLSCRCVLSASVSILLEAKQWCSRLPQLSSGLRRKLRASFVNTLTSAPVLKHTLLSDTQPCALSLTLFSMLVLCVRCGGRTKMSQGTACLVEACIIQTIWERTSTTLHSTPTYNVQYRPASFPFSWSLSLDQSLQYGDGPAGLISNDLFLKTASTITQPTKAK